MQIFSSLVGEQNLSKHDKLFHSLTRLQKYYQKYSLSFS